MLQVAQQHRIAHILQGLAWTLGSIAIVATFGRFYLRFKKLKKWGLEDLLNAVALAALICYFAMFDAVFPILLQIEDFSKGLTDSSPSDDQMRHANKLNLAAIMLFWITIYAVKGSFLATYRTLFSISHAFRRAQLPAIIYILISFLATVVGALWNCGSPSLIFDVKSCNNPPAQQLVNLQIYWCVLNISGDIILMILPLWMLSALHLRRRQKMGLAIVFLVVIIDILFDCLRTAYSINANLGNTNDNINWDNCEAAIAVMVCAFPTYRTLFTSDSRSTGRSYEQIRRNGASMGYGSAPSARAQALTNLDATGEQSSHSDV